MANEELILYRLDEMKVSLAEIKDEVKAGRKDYADLEKRVDAVEHAQPATNGSAGKVAAATGGVAGAVLILLSYAGEWIRSRFG